MNRSLIVKSLISVAVFGIVTVGLSLSAKYWIHHATKDCVYNNINDVPKSRVAVVLGARVYPSGNLSCQLEDRVDTAIDLYKAGKVEKLLMSGDNSVSHYDEPTQMMKYAIAHGVPAKDVTADFAGRRTFDSMYRAKHIFGLDKFIVVSQSYHDERAIFLCRHLGIDACAVSADRHDNAKARFREIPACVSAFLDVYMLHPKPLMGKKEHI